MPIFRKVNTETGELDGQFYGEGGVKIGPEFVPAARLAERSIFPQIDPDYNQNTHIVSELYFDNEKRIVTRDVIEFSKGIAYNWKSRNFVGGELFRKIRIRVKWLDTLTGGVLEAKANDMIKSGSPFYRVDADGTSNQVGAYTEIYLNYITEADKAQIQGYVSATSGAVYEEYEQLN